MRRRPFAVAALALALILLAALLVAWLARFRVANAIVARRLAAAEVPASYRITRIGPFQERMEDVRIGDPAAPDLVARRIDVLIGYDLTGPAVRGVMVEGVRLRARIDRAGLHMGALDRLLPKGAAGKAKFPDMLLRLRDTQLLLGTPNGAIRAAIHGGGNPARSFRGTAAITAPALRLAACDLGGVEAELRIGAEGGRPGATGPVRIARTTCPDLALGAGELRIALSSNATLDRVTLQAAPTGFGGKAGAARFAGLSGSVEAGGAFGDLNAQATLGVHALSLRDAAAVVTRSAKNLVETPLGPTGARAGSALARLLGEAEARAELTARIHGYQADFRLRQLMLTGRDGGRLIARERGGMTWASQGWRADADVSMGGGALPALAVALRQAAPGAPLTGSAQLAPYRAGAAQLATAQPLRFAWDGRKASFDTVLLIDGPVANGFVQGLAVPVRGYAGTRGFLVGQGCQPVSFRQLRLASFTFDPARIAVCGRPIVSGANGAMRVDATSGPIRLTGHTSGGAPVALGATRLHVSEQGFAADQLDATLGGATQPTHLAIGALDGTMRGASLGGRFANMGGAIGNVPLILADSEGVWTFKNGLLQLTGKLRVSDSAAAVRFNPLVTDNAELSLKGGVIAATATLREPATRAEVTKVDLRHDLSGGTGRALLAVPGLNFAPKRLQPDQLTPFTLGVIANVSGTITGNGRIDWRPNGVTSSGVFGTERVDLAAAFGPVTGIKGQIHFTDLLGLVSAPGQEATIAEMNPGVSVTNGVVHYRLPGQNRVQVEDAAWPFAGGMLRLDPTTLDFDQRAERHLTFRVEKLDAAAFVQQLDFPNISATGTFDGVLPMIFDHNGGRIEAGVIRARPGGGSLAYVGELTNADLGTMGKLAFDALKAIRYSALEISLDGRLDGEMVSRVRFTGVREATPEQSLVTRLIRNLPFRFNIEIRAPFRGLVGSARAYIDPRLLLNQANLPPKTPAEPAIQPPASGDVR
jgi:hypothetical protein